jgi:hypothetical protein
LRGNTDGTNPHSFMHLWYSTATGGGVKYFNELNVSGEVHIPNCDQGKRLVALVCLLLTLVAAIGEASHVHLKARATDSPIRCSLCVAAHSAKPAPLCQPLRNVRVVSRLVVQQNPIAGSRFVSSDLFVRPPPFAS